ncbi:hypothetical protein [Psychromonas sp. SR45-3]|uniref:hypothetical protein n=1 Tax=Psychromonas sp. SR45-3 TaxID=2760930 RepID=UPI0015FE06DF|nr:hypothetical protein [Psychromonas sp. SR45-3]MBB1273112.1 hypothetical protein [Psychromonas sp. SR45-3]
MNNIIVACSAILFQYVNLTFFIEHFSLSYHRHITTFNLQTQKINIIQHLKEKPSSGIIFAPI